MYVYKRITFIFIIILHISNGTKIVFSNKRPICKIFCSGKLKILKKNLAMSPVKRNCIFERRNSLFFLLKVKKLESKHR